MKNYLYEIRKIAKKSMTTLLLRKREQVINEIRQPITSIMLDNVNAINASTGNLKFYSDEKAYKLNILYKNILIFTDKEITELKREIEEPIKVQQLKKR